MRWWVKMCMVWVGIVFGCLGMVNTTTPSLFTKASQFECNLPTLAFGALECSLNYTTDAPNRKSKGGRRQGETMTRIRENLQVFGHVPFLISCLSGGPLLAG